MGKSLTPEALEHMGKKELRRMAAELEASKAQLKELDQQMEAMKDDRRVVILPPVPAGVELPPLKGKELKCVEDLVGMESRIVESGDALRERLRMVPNGWRDFRLIFTTLDRLLRNLYDTIPNKGLQYLQKLTKHGEILIRFSPAARSQEWLLIKDDDLAVIVNLAMAAECAICLKQGREAKKCELRKALENIAPPHDGHPAGGCGYQNVVAGEELGHYLRRVRDV